MSNSAIEISNLSKQYKNNTKLALNNINLTIEKGSFFGLLGPNGAGKSTLINIIAGVANKTTGTVKVCGIDYDADQVKAKYKLGIVPQELYLDPFFTVREALDLQAGYYGVSKRNRKTDELLKVFNLLDKSCSTSHKLSGGMKRRLLVAKAMVHSPEIIILDEPTAGVDVDLRTKLWEHIKMLNDNGTTILLTTHYLEEAEQLCDRIAVLNNGSIIVNEEKKSLMKMLNLKEIIVNFIGEIELQTIETKLVDYDFEIKDQYLHIKYDPNKVDISSILSSLEGMKIKDIVTKEPSLEDVFKHLVK